MRLAAIRRGIWRLGALALSALPLALSAGSCGKVQDSRPLFDSNTNWLVPCVADDQCTGSLRCYCGQCTKPCSQDGECSLLRDALCAESSEALCGDGASAGGLCVKGCVEDAECGPRFSCRAGQCVPDPCSAGQCSARSCGMGVDRSWDDVFELASADLVALDEDALIYQRYFVLSNESELSDPGTGQCEASLERKRQALSKLLNSLSLDVNIEQPLPIDSERRIYRIDLRNYQWDRSVRVGAPVYADVWEALIANDDYAIPFVGTAADALKASTNSAVPVLLADSFIAAATRPELYSAILELPPRLEELMAGQLQVAPGREPSIQAGFIDEAELVAQRWDMGTRIGFVWTIADFGRPPGSLFDDPLQEPLGERELIFTLPNGMLAFAFANPDGQLLPSWSVTRDPREADRVARVPRSNWRRHAGALAIRDQVRSYVASNESQYAGSLSDIERRYPGAEALSLVLERDADQLTRRALQMAGLDPFQPDPITRVHEDFEGAVTLDAAAAVLFITPRDLLDNLQLLDPALSALEGGTVPRSVFTANYAVTVCTLSTVLENQPEVAPCL